MTTIQCPTIEEWNRLLARAVPWIDAYAAVATHARALLELHNPQDGLSTISTAALVELMYPEAWARGPDGIYARARIFHALKALAVRSLGDCCTRANPYLAKAGPLKGKVMRPWRWHKPTGAPNSEAAGKVCPVCGQDMST